MVFFNSFHQLSVLLSGSLKSVVVKSSSKPTNEEKIVEIDKRKTKFHPCRTETAAVKNNNADKLKRRTGMDSQTDTIKHPPNSAPNLFINFSNLLLYFVHLLVLLICFTFS